MSIEKTYRRALIFTIILNAILLSFFAPYTVRFVPNIAVSGEIAETKTVPVKETFVASVSAYTSRPEETDDTPFITANGDHVYFGGVACPSRYSFGTEVRIDGKVYKCNDRMNKRYRSGNYFDIWMSDYDRAIEHGRRSVTVEILGA